MRPNPLPMVLAASLQGDLAIGTTASLRRGFFMQPHGLDQNRDERFGAVGQGDSVPAGEASGEEAQ
jgi:hypothetical protein